CCDSLAKYAAAFFKTSRSCFTSASSLRSRAISLSSSCAVLAPLTGPRPCLAAATQFAIVPFGTDRRCEASPCVRFCSRTSRTASERSSGEYCWIVLFLVFFTRLLLLVVYQAGVSDLFSPPQTSLGRV